MEIKNGSSYCIGYLEDLFQLTTYHQQKVFHQNNSHFSQESLTVKCYFIKIA